ncbi:MAG: hypothetical protein FWC54_01505 [Actinomycetia bacterium]|nr:hypothetical protein [Actinomycetes bacterium]
MDSSDNELKQVVPDKIPDRPAAPDAAHETRPPHESVGRALLRYGVFALIALLCFSIAAFALEIWPAYAHYQEDYAAKGVWTAWFNGPILERDQEIVDATLPDDAHVAYSFTGDLESVSAGKRKLSGAADELRYYLAPSTKDGESLLGTWVASNTIAAGRNQATTPVIIDQRTARRLGVGAGDAISLEVKLADEHSNEVQGRFTALITAVARPTAQFKGVALVSEPMTRFVSSAQQVAATDFYVFGGSKSTPQDLADVLAQDQVRGALRSEMVKAAAEIRSGSASALRYGIASIVIVVLGVYTLGELYFSARIWRTTDKYGLFSLRRVRLRTALDTLICVLIFVVTAAAGILVSLVLIRLLMTYEPLWSTAIQMMILFAFISAALIVARAALAHMMFGKYAATPLNTAPDRD